MKPQKKAKELVKNYLNYTSAYLTINDAKQCALIAVEEIIKANPIIPLTCMLESDAIDTAIEYWNEVKAEIEKL
jgi:hypothetical protein